MKGYLFHSHICAHKQCKIFFKMIFLFLCFQIIVADTNVKNNEMQILVFHENLFFDTWDPPKIVSRDYYYKFERAVEKYAYECLITQPLNKSVNYLAVPWAALFRKERLDGFKPNLKLKGGFTICYHLTEKYKKNLIFSQLKKIGINCVFSPGASLEEREYKGIHIEPFPYVAINGVEPSSNKDILYSFIGKEAVGDSNTDCRKRVFSMKHPQGTIIIKRTHFFPDYPCIGKKEEKKNFKKMIDEYKVILSRSRFSLCPRGAQPNSIRFWESLQAGAIPVLISDTARLPEWFDWNSCVIHVAEKDVEKIPQIIANISLKQEEEMRRNCLKAYKLFSGDNLVSVIRAYYQDVN